jgi:endonuclease/exonuclease/phosphatase family metal-dependent hydrolase
MLHAVRRLPRWTVAALAATALLVGGVFVTQQASAASSVSAMTFNVCGAVCNRGEVNRLASFTASKVTLSKVTVAFLQELCYSQYHRIKELVEPAGYTTLYASTTSSGYCDNDDNRWGTGFGMAIVVKGKTKGRVVVPLPVARGAERRSLLGGVATIGGRATFVAVVHNSPTVEQGLTKQLTKVATYLNWKASRHPVIAGGDFNAMPDSPGMAALYSPHAGGTGRFTELDELHHNGSAARSGEATFDAARRKIDYLFVSAKHFRSPHADSSPTAISDHCVYSGTARIA